MGMGVESKRRRMPCPHRLPVSDSGGRFSCPFPELTMAWLTEQFRGPPALRARRGMRRRTRRGSKRMRRYFEPSLSGGITPRSAGSVCLGWSWRSSSSFFCSGSRTLGRAGSESKCICAFGFRLLMLPSTLGSHAVTRAGVGRYTRHCSAASNAARIPRSTVTNEASAQIWILKMTGTN